MGLAADVAGVDADLGRTAFRRGDGKAVVKVDVRHERQRRTRRDCSKPLCSRLIRHGKARQLTPGRLERGDLGKAALHVRCGGVQHGLDRDRRAAADAHAARIDLSGHSWPPQVKRWKISLNVMTAISRSRSTMPTPLIHASYLGLSFLRVMRSMSVVSSRPTMRPPSSAGMGSRFITPRLMAMKEK